MKSTKTYFMEDWQNLERENNIYECMVLESTEFKSLNLSLNNEGYPFHVERDGLSSYRCYLNNSKGVFGNLVISTEAKTFIEKTINLIVHREDLHYDWYSIESKFSIGKPSLVTV